jgi:AcrR family transcriptional regulator
MSRNHPSNPSFLKSKSGKPPARAPARKPIVRKLDERARRTRQRLGTALIELILERSINEVTVQEVLDRARVGRSTFYLHFRDKNDLLLSQLEMFLEVMSTILSQRNERSHRVVPVEEMFAHIGPQNQLYRSLADSGHLHDFYELAQDYFTRGIEQRLRESGRLANLPQAELSARATALAGSVLSLLKWWIDHGGKETPTAMDQLFHRMVWKGVQS